MKYFHELIMLNFSFKSLKSDHGKILLEIENENENPVTVSTDIILHDGFTSNKFKVIDKNTGTVLSYLGKSVKYTPEKVEMKSHQKLTSELDLKEVYNLQKCHEYLVEFHSIGVVEGNVLNLSGEITIESEGC